MPFLLETESKVLFNSFHILKRVFVLKSTSSVDCKQKVRFYVLPAYGKIFDVH